MRKKNSEFQFHVNYDFTASKPCIKKRCDGFMMPVLVQYYSNGPIFDEFECYSCRAKQRMKVFRSNRKEFRRDG